VACCSIGTCKARSEICRVDHFSAHPPSLEAVALEYFHWVHSHPFDMGHTTESAMGACHEVHQGQNICAQVIRDAATDRCMNSKANGSLMRATPLAIWGHALPASVLAEWARADSGLSHPNLACTDSVAAYVIAIAHLLNHPAIAMEQSL
jgi:ADP-ribosyl-[dinitrogen reductase] hydrolase